VIQALTDYDVPTSADISAITSAVVSGVLNSYNVASAGDVLTSAQVSTIGVQVLADADIPSSAEVSTIMRGVRVNIGRVNDVSVSGAGTTADPWRPA
jgi:hypothetical protein